MVEPEPRWQRKGQIRVLLIALGAAVAASIAYIGVGFLMQKLGWANVSAGSLTLPWVIALVLVVPMAYRRGIRDERDNRDSRDK